MRLCVLQGVDDGNRFFLFSHYIYTPRLLRFVVIEIDLIYGYLYYEGEQGSLLEICICLLDGAYEFYYAFTRCDKCRIMFERLYYSLSVFY